MEQHRAVRACSAAAQRAWPERGWSGGAGGRALEGGLWVHACVIRWMLAASLIQAASDNREGQGHQRCTARHSAGASTQRGNRRRRSGPRRGLRWWGVGGPPAVAARGTSAHCLRRSHQPTRAVHMPRLICMPKLICMRPALQNSGYAAHCSTTPGAHLVGGSCCGRCQFKPSHGSQAHRARSEAHKQCWAGARRLWLQ